MADNKKHTVKDVYEMILELTTIVGEVQAELALHRGTPDAHNPAFMTDKPTASWRAKTVQRKE